MIFELYLLNFAKKKKKKKIHFPIIISTTVAHIRLKFDVLMYLMNIQVKFEFGSSPMSYAFWS